MGACTSRRLPAVRPGPSAPSDSAAPITQTTAKNVQQEHAHDPWAPFAQATKIRAQQQWPEGTLFEPWPVDAAPADMLEHLRGKPRRLAPMLAGKRTLLVGMPGAYTPNCSQVHLPQYIAHAAEFYAAGIDQIIVVVCNDVCVAGAWARETAPLPSASASWSTATATSHG